MSWTASAYLTPNGFISANGGILGCVYSDGNYSASSIDSALPGYFPFIVRWSTGGDGHLSALPVYPSALSAFDELRVGWSAQDSIVMSATGEGTSVLPVSSVTASTTTMYMGVKVWREWIDVYSTTGNTWHTLDAAGSGKRKVYADGHGLNFYQTTPWFTATAGTYTVYSGSLSNHTSVPATESSRESVSAGVYAFPGDSDHLYITGITAVVYDKPL